MKAPSTVGCPREIKSRECRVALTPGALDQGGCIETTRPTKYEDPVLVEAGVIHYCVANIPDAYTPTLTQALTSVTLPYQQTLAINDLELACQISPELIGGINCLKGRLTGATVAEAHGMEWSTHFA